jgi:gliding motility-associated lipoprotein GldH
MRKAVLAAGAAALLLGGCSPDALFSGSKSIPEGGWRADEPVSFTWEVTDTLQRCDFFVDLRHNQEYPFSNIYLFLEFTFPNGKIGRDTLGCDLADERGRWYGSGFGNLVDHRIGFREATSFPLTGSYTVTMRHAMRTDPLPGIEDVGFRLEAQALAP